MGRKQSNSNHTDWDTPIDVATKLKLIQDLAADEGVTDAEFRVAVAALVAFHSCQTGQCNPSIPKLAEAAAKGERAVQRAMVSLETKGKVEAHRTNGGFNRRNRYRFRPNGVIRDTVQTDATASTVSSVTRTVSSVARAVSSVTPNGVIRDTRIEHLKEPLKESLKETLAPDGANFKFLGGKGEQADSSGVNQLPTIPLPISGAKQPTIRRKPLKIEQIEKGLQDLVGEARYQNAVELLSPNDLAAAERAERRGTSGVSYLYRCLQQAELRNLEPKRATA